jgi:hypothetical protein
MPDTEDPRMQPLQDRDTSIAQSPEQDAAQIEWDRTELADRGIEADTATATGADPDEIPRDDEEIPRDDLVPEDAQPESQGDDPLESELGEDGQGDLAPEDL